MNPTSRIPRTPARAAFLAGGLPRGGDGVCHRPAAPGTAISSGLGSSVTWSPT